MTRAQKGSEIACLLGSQLVGQDFEITGVCSVKNSASGKLGFFIGDASSFPDEVIAHGVYLVSEVPIHRGDLSFIRVDHPRLAFAKVSSLFEDEQPAKRIHPSALIDMSAKIHSSVRIGANSIIEKQCVIGEGSIVESGVVLKRRTFVGVNTTIRANSVIGGPGFGFEIDESGIPTRISHFGNVEIGKNVEIGSNVVISRGTLDATIIGDDVKIDDHVFIAHNVEIGPRTLVIAGAEISGSVVIGADCWISPQSTVLQKIKIGDKATVGLGAVVIENVPPGAVVVGNPARVISVKSKK